MRAHARNTEREKALDRKLPVELASFWGTRINQIARGTEVKHQSNAEDRLDDLGGLEVYDQG